MAKRKSSKVSVGVSRRATKTKSTATRTVKRKKPTRMVKSESVKEVEDQLSTLSTHEQAIYNKIREELSSVNSSETMTYYRIGKLLMSARAKNIRSGADERIRMAANIDKSKARIMRSMAEKFKEEDLLEYTKMRNPTTGWTIPVSSFYLIAMRSTPANQRARVEKVVLEQMASEHIQQRFALTSGKKDSDKPSEEGEVKGVERLKKLTTLTAKQRQSLDDFLDEEFQKNLEGSFREDITVKTRQSLAELMTNLRYVSKQAQEVAEVVGVLLDEGVKDDENYDDED